MSKEALKRQKIFEQRLQKSGYKSFQEKVKKMKNKFNLDELFRGVKLCSLEQLNEMENDILKYNTNKLLHNEKKDYRNLIGEVLMSTIQSQKTKKQSEEKLKFIPFIEIDSFRVNWSKAIKDIVLESLYTNKFAYANIFFTLEQPMSLQHFYHELYRFKRSKSIEIQESNNSIRANQKDQVMECIKFDSLDLLKVQGGEHFISLILQTISPQKPIQTLYLKSEYLNQFLKQSTLAHISNIREFKLKLTHHRSDDIYYDFMNFCFAQPQILNFTYIQSRDHDNYHNQDFYYESFCQSDRGKKRNKKFTETFFNSIKKRHMEIQELSLTSNEWSDYHILRKLGEFKRLINFTLISQNRRSSRRNSSSSQDKNLKQLKRLQVQCLQRKKGLYGLAKQKKDKSFMKLGKQSLFLKIYTKYVVGSVPKKKYYH